MHSQLGEQREAISRYRQALALVGERGNPMACGVLVIMLAEFGDARRVVGDLPAAVAAWCSAVQVLNDLGWPDLLEVGARLERADLPSPQYRFATLLPGGRTGRRQLRRRVCHLP